MLPKGRVAFCLVFTGCSQAQAEGMVFIYRQSHQLAVQWCPGDSAAAGMNGGVLSLHSTTVPLGHTDNGLQRRLLPGSRDGPGLSGPAATVGFLNRNEGTVFPQDHLW